MWSWEDGKPWEYENWARFEPNNRDVYWGGEDCAELVLSSFGSGTLGYWNDRNCDTTRNPYVCSKPMIM